jgi:predicted hotdog family 3-hydroxylacyl-ACP dehydratase
MAQCVAVFGGNCSLIEGQSVEIGFLLGTRKYKAYVDFFTKGQDLIVEAKLSFRDEMLSNFECKIYSDSNILAEASLTTFKPDKAMLEKLKKGILLV